ncbi:MAG: hypothetical protein JSW07_01685 [bacterium]|nr:MAG: hypothetical protein JSW07_01685 [bacterium]
MEERFKSIPLTILDILGIFLPGSVWLVLLVTTFNLKFENTIGDGISPLASCKAIASFFQDLNSPLLATLVFIVVSLLIGYTLRPIAMRLAEWFSRPFQKLHKSTKGLKLHELKFPYTVLFEKEPFYQNILDIIENVTNCNPDSLPRHQPFSAAKRFLRLISPSLWEESERREAEVRMMGAVLLAMIYSSILSLIVLLLQYIKVIQFQDITGTWIWFIVSIIAFVVLSMGFCRSRYSEVVNTYLNTLIAYNQLVKDESLKNKV